MGIRKIPIMETRYHLKNTRVPNTHKITPGKYTWVYKILMWLLSKFCYVSEYHETDRLVTYQEVMINENELAKELFKHVNDIEAIINKDVDRIIMGPNQYGILRANEVLQPFSFTMETGVRGHYNEEPFHFDGLRVQVIPWMDGILAIPKIKN